LSTSFVAHQGSSPGKLNDSWRVHEGFMEGT
jgi:hypothetical protein